MHVLILTEANQTVATGHLYESITLFSELKKRGIESVVGINHNINEKWVKLLEGVKYFFYGNSIIESREIICRTAELYDVDLIVTDVRCLNQNEIAMLRDVENVGIICLDEWGNREIDADIIVNNMADESFWNYGNSKAKMFFGEQYLMLSSNLQEYRSREKVISPVIHNVLVTLGGVDKFNHTEMILDKLKNMDTLDIINVVMGVGYQYEDQLRKKMKGNEKICFHRSIDYLYDLVYAADLVFCAGGNTMYEIAAIGTPCLILPTMEHERINTIAFCKKGFGQLISVDDIYELGRIMQDFDFEERKIMSEKGKMLIDGLGVYRILDLITEVKK